MKLKFFVLVVLCAAVLAQTKMATISGVLQDPNGKPVTGSDVRRALEAGLAGEAVPGDQHMAVGCGIKWDQ